VTFKTYNLIHFDFSQSYEEFLTSVKSFHSADERNITIFYHSQKKV